MARELFITCQRAACGAVVPVKNPYEQRRRRFCSRRCNALAHHPLNKAAQRQGGLVRARRMRQLAAKRFEGLTAMQIFRLAFSQGWKQGVRTERRRQSEAA